MALTLLAAYDIREDRRRARVAATLQRWGDRIQDSVFVCLVENEAVPGLVEAVRAIIDVETDSFLLLRQCAACWGERVTVGQGEPEPPTLYWAVV